MLGEVAPSVRLAHLQMAPSNLRSGQCAPAGLCPVPVSWDFLSDIVGTCVPLRPQPLGLVAGAQYMFGERMSG